MSILHLPKVAVVVLSWNGKKFLQQFLPSLLQTTYSNTHFYVADNCSTDDSVAYIKEHFPTVNIIQIPQNEGFAKGYNTALQQVEADIYVLLNQDVEVTPNWIEPVVKMFSENSNLAVVQPKIKDFKNKDYFEYAGAAGGFVDWLGYPFCRGRIFDTVEKDNAQYNNDIEIFWASGACLFINSKVYHELGGLDADFFAHMEEIDLCWRVKNAGYKIQYCGQSTVYHVGGGSLPYGNPKKTYLNFRNNLIMMIKNNHSNAFWLILFLRMVLDGISAIKLLLEGKFSDFKAIFSAHIYLYANFSNSLRKRKLAITMSKTHAQEGVYAKSIVWQYFIKGNKTFAELISIK
jgi:GT2 family glycosyltransferase